MLKHLVCVLASLSITSTHDVRTEQIINGIDRGLDYILEKSDDFNIDGVLGVILAEVSLRKILVDRHDEDILKLANKARTIYNIVKPNLPNDSYTDNIIKDHLIDFHVWNATARFEANQLDENVKPAHLETLDDLLYYMSMDDFQEEFSDYCIADLLLTKMMTYSRCIDDEKCTDRMVRSTEINPGYGVTHRLLYLYIYNLKGCEPLKPIGEYERLTKTYCSQIWWEAKADYKFGFPRYFDDLLLEQITLCGTMGFSEFLNKAFMDHVLAIETDRGCFSPNVNHKRRQKRKADIDDEGCINHTNGLGLSTLSLYLRYLIEQEKC